MQQFVCFIRFFPALAVYQILSFLLETHLNAELHWQTANSHTQASCSTNENQLGGKRSTRRYTEAAQHNTNFTSHVDVSAI